MPAIIPAPKARAPEAGLASPRSTLVTLLDLPPYCLPSRAYIIAADRRIWPTWRAYQARTRCRYVRSQPEGSGPFTSQYLPLHSKRLTSHRHTTPQNDFVIRASGTQVLFSYVNPSVARGCGARLVFFCAESRSPRRLWCGFPQTQFPALGISPLDQLSRLCRERYVLVVQREGGRYIRAKHGTLYSGVQKEGTR